MSQFLNVTPVKQVSSQCQKHVAVVCINKNGFKLIFNLKRILYGVETYIVMDPCFQDVVIEFLAVSFHSILYFSSVYPKTVFEARKKYNVVVYSCIHPEINQYIDLCLKSLKECLKNGQLSRVVFAITNAEYEPILKFVFDVHKNIDYDETADAYLIQVEQNLRAFLINLSVNEKFKDLPEDTSFSIHIHTNESTAVSMATNPEFEEFPLVEVSEKMKEMDVIVPLRSFPIRSYRLETYIEL